MFRHLRTSLCLFLLLMAITGFAYPLVTLLAGQKIFPDQANGSLITENGKITGSALIAQKFDSDIYFHSRPSAAGNGYDAANSSGSNLATTSADLLKVVTDRTMILKQNANASVPVDLVTSSGSGLDPDISPASARFQAARIAVSRHIEMTKIHELISAHIQPPVFGVFGDNRVNVLELNRALDQLAPPVPPAVK